jgi:hypothetical protein
MAMNRRITLGTYLAIGLLGITAATAADPARSGKAKPIPPFSEVRQAVERHFEANRDYRSGDLITREEVEPLLVRIERMGLPLPDAKRIRESVLAKDSFLAQQLATPNGRKFMREIAGYPNGYDRLDRLSRLPRGQKIVRELIKGPGGEELIEYMTTAKGGKELGKMLSKGPQGADFNAPTGRIYTVNMLLKRLQQCHAAALKPAKKSPGK